MISIFKELCSTLSVGCYEAKYKKKGYKINVSLRNAYSIAFLSLQLLSIIFINFQRHGLLKIFGFQRVLYGSTFLTQNHKIDGLE